jgi:hypothetical protein
MINYVVPPAAVEVAELHRRFAKAVVATRNGGYDAKGSEALSALAESASPRGGRSVTNADSHCACTRTRQWASRAV